jgi:tetratricopeptide (TPR) repeat protein
MYDEIHAWLYQKSALFNFALSGERLKQTLSYVRQLLVEETGHTYLDYGLYTAIWKYWIAPSPDANDWVSQEINDIEQQTTDSISSSLSAAKAFLYLYQSRFSEAWEALEASGTLKKAPTTLFLPFLHHISGSRDWGNLVDWLLRTASYFYGQRNKELDAYIGCWKEAVAHYPEAEKHMWNVLEGMLPHSTLIIEDLLYEQRKWKPWLEMQIIKGHDPLYHRVSVLQPIEKEAPSLLLPYYHQAVEHYVTLKNRDDYKLAVRLLKKLEKIYHKIKQAERWERFFTGFMERHSRLRALQEEMKKGKLLE